jgi:hypothetical protein
VKNTESLRFSVRRELGLGRPAGSSLRILAFAGLLWSLDAAAQPPYRQEILPGVSSLSIAQGSARPRLVDLDGDGDSDLAVGGEDGTLTFFESVPGKDGPTFVGVAPGASPFAGIDVGSRCDPAFATSTATAISTWWWPTARPAISAISAMPRHPPSSS